MISPELKIQAVKTKKGTDIRKHCCVFVEIISSLAQCDLHLDLSAETSFSTMCVRVQSDRDRESEIINRELHTPVGALLRVRLFLSVRSLVCQYVCFLSVMHPADEESRYTLHIHAHKSHHSTASWSRMGDENRKCDEWTNKHTCNELM